MSASLFAQAMREFFHHHHAWPAQYFEERLAQIYRNVLEPGDIAIDIGAHTGYHASRMLDAVGETGHVVCIEPLPEIFQQLTENLAGYSNATLFNGVVSDVEGEVTFQRAVGLPGESGLKERKRYDKPGTTTETITVRSTTLDDVAALLDKVNFIKIDTEGAELTILSSGPGTLARVRPIVSVEWGSDTYLPYGHHAGSLFEFARAHQYTIVDLFSNMICSAREWSEVSDRASWDFILVPDEKLAWYMYRQNA